MTENIETSTKHSYDIYVPVLHTSYLQKNITILAYDLQ